MPYPTYTISDFNSELFSAQITGAIASAVYLGYNREDDVVTVYHDQDPSAADKTVIDNLVAGHDPTNFIVDDAKLHKEELSTPDGRVLRETWYAFYDSAADQFSFKRRERTYTWSAHVLTQVKTDDYDLLGSLTSSTTQLTEEDKVNNIRRWRTI